jgi:hypothetical protein
MMRQELLASYTEMSVYSITESCKFIMHSLKPTREHPTLNILSQLSIRTHCHYTNQLFICPLGKFLHLSRVGDSADEFTILTKPGIDVTVHQTEEFCISDVHYM